VPGSMCIDDQPIQVGNAHFAWHYRKMFTRAAANPNVRMQ